MCLWIHLLKACRPVCTENTQSTWVYGIAYIFRTIKGPKVKVSISEQRHVLLMLNLLATDHDDETALCINL